MTEYDERMRRLAAVRPRLVSFARLQLRDAAMAEDAVQEAIATAIDKNDTFSARPGYETWAFGILKYKILDALKTQKRYATWQPFDEALEEDNVRFAALTRPTR